MTKKELEDARDEALRDGDSYTITLETSEDAREVDVNVRSTAPMNKLDLILALVDWINGFVAEDDGH